MDAHDDIAGRLAFVHERIAAACARSGRAAGDVRLVAVSKLQPTSLIREAHAAGQRDFGENYAQDLRDRAVELADLDGLRWHAIGPLQTNKVKYVARAASSFHALDRDAVAVALSRLREDDPIEVYVEVNVAGEDSKSGVSPEAAPDLVARARDLPGLRVVGLMCMPPLPDDLAGWDPAANRPWFRALRRLADQLGLAGLSMGTTSDYEVAVEEGATVVRVGRTIFGERRLQRGGAPA